LAKPFFGRATAGLGLCGWNVSLMAAIGVRLLAVVRSGDKLPKLRNGRVYAALRATALNPSRS